MADQPGGRHCWVKKGLEALNLETLFVARHIVLCILCLRRREHEAAFLDVCNCICRIETVFSNRGKVSCNYCRSNFVVTLTVK
jgi:hypothetical protein